MPGVTAMEVTPRLSRETGRQYALRVIRDNIVRLALPPGSLISESELAAQLGLSRTPVREALIELSQDRLVVVAPQKRSMVAPIDEALVEEARFSRSVLECAVVELVCARADEADLRDLRENVRLQAFYRENNRIAPIMELDNRLHAQLFRIARMEDVYRMVARLAVHFDRVRTIALHDIRDLSIIEDHDAIVEAIARRAPEEARAVMQRHLNRGSVDIVAIRQRFPQYFG